MNWVIAVILSLVVCIGLVYMGFRQGHNVYIAGYNQGYTDAFNARPLSPSCNNEQRTGEGKRDKR